ncbi:hypothetical protein CRG98_009888 [Punica granatum]|uniref:Uncharacterized protein n=1 Tax=Punica granatum TaxID=22663 RepID=A0A2I0KMM1_PUNGR|nr:hypothetical protein CRG98_009888 [Punica granatum]
MEAMNRADAETGSPAGGSMLQLSKGSGEEMSEFHETEPMPMEWTDEKHNLYLKSMEASFMNQLHDSMNLLSERFKNYNLSNIDSSLLRSNTDSPSGQFKVHQDGNWKKLSFKRPAADVSSDELLASPWIQHFRPVSKLSGMEHDNGRRIAASTGQNALTSYSRCLQRFQIRTLPAMMAKKKPEEPYAGHREHYQAVIRQLTKARLLRLKTVPHASAISTVLIATRSRQK